MSVKVTAQPSLRNRATKVRVTCDKCGQWASGSHTGYSVRGAAEDARKNSGYISVCPEKYREKDFCPSCAKKVTIKELSVM